MDEQEKAKLMSERAELRAKLEALEAEKSKREAAAAATENRPLDEDDRLRLENLLLKEKLIERDRNDARNAFYSRLVKKYGIDTDKFELSVDATTMTLGLKPR